MKTQGGCRGIALLFHLPQPSVGVCGQHCSLSAVSPWITRYPFYFSMISSYKLCAPIQYTVFRNLKFGKWIIVCSTFHAKCNMKDLVLLLQFSAYIYIYIYTHTCLIIIIILNYFCTNNFNCYTPTTLQ